LHFADGVGGWLPRAPERFEMMATEPIPLMRCGGVAGNGLYGRQTLRGNLVYGGGPHEWINVPDMAAPDHPNTPLVRNLARRLAELFPGAAHVRLIRAWGGIVANTPDGLPVIDRLASPGNVILATMSSVGFGLSPAVGGGAAGVAAAVEAAEAGVEVLLVDENPVDNDTMAMDVPLYFGQRMQPSVRNRALMLERVVESNPALASAYEAGVDVQLGTCV